MRIDVKFTDSSQEFKTQFRDAVIIKDGYTQEELDAAVSNGYDAGVEDGKQAEWNAFWDAFQDNGNRTEYGYAFRTTCWTDENFRPKYPFILGRYGAYQMFQGTGITDFTRDGIVLDFSEAVDMRYIFADTKNTEMKLPTIDMSSASATYQTFGNYWGKDLSVILREETDYSDTFAGTLYLENLSINGTISKAIKLKDSSLLSDESIQSVINALKDLTGATAQTLTLHATVGAKLTDAQKATITAKNWTLVY